MKFRQAQQSDMSAIAALHATSWQLNYQGILKADYLRDQALSDRTKLWQQRLAQPANNQYILLALDNDLICGFICVLTGQHPQYGSLIDNLHVAPNFKGQGLGTKLVRQGASWSLAQLPEAGLYLEVLAENTAAIGFYRSLGALPIQKNNWTAPCGSIVAEFIYSWQKPAQLVASCRETGIVSPQ
jgi:ribosomal protein S18 acetylase RimI-like enzyme